MKKRIGAKNLKIGEQDEQGGCWFRLRVVVAFKKKARATYSSDWEVHYIEVRALDGHEALEKVKRLFAKNQWIGDDTQVKLVDADDRHFLA
jgi:hypothetical protein